MSRALALAVLLAACAQPPALPATRQAAAPASAPSRVAAGARDATTCPPPSGAEPPVLLDGAPLLVLCHGVYAEAATTASEREALQRWYGESLRALAAFFGTPPSEPAIVVSCKTDACMLHFSGPTRRSRVLRGLPPRVVVNGLGSLTKGTIVHEMVHVEIARRRGQRGLPTWFDEGIATFVGDNVRCAADEPRVIDDLRRLDTPHAWEGFADFPGHHDPYCQARLEIATWVEKHSRDALVKVIDTVAAGGSFDERYGPLATAIPSTSFRRSLDGAFLLDENTGTNAVDSSGHSHIATLMSGAIWTTGHRGAGVKVIGGAHVRVDGLLDLAVPDSPFSITLWAKPLANAKVLVHGAAQPSGSNGWCTPMLGHDAAGHLVAQVPFGATPQAFLAATGPVLPLDTWSHVAMTWSAADGVRLFVNGALAASAPPKSAEERHRDAPASPMYLFLGSNQQSRCWTHSIDGGDWNGAIDELRVYDHALAPDDVRREAR